MSTGQEEESQGDRERREQMLRTARVGAWHDAIEELNRETSRASAEAFSRGERARSREFLILPFLAAWRAFRAFPGRRWEMAIRQGYRELTVAAKLWEAETRWREREGVSWAEGTRFCLVRSRWREHAAEILEPSDAVPLAGGRGTSLCAETPIGRVVLRRFRRGGAMRWLGSLYFGRNFRPHSEFWTLLDARRRGLAVPEPVAAEARRVFGIAYTGALAMIEIPDARSLAEAVRDRPEIGWVGPVGQAIRGMHDAGLHHPDLNIGNILLVESGSGLAVWLVDLDRATIRSRSVSPRARRRALRRLRRSARSIDPAGEVFRESDLSELESACLR